MATSKKGNGLKKLHARVAGLMEASEAVDRLTSCTDVELAILGPAYLDRALRFALETKFVQELSNTDRNDLFDVRGPLGTYSSKISLGNALGLYSKDLRSDLNAIKDIRNLFAHASIPLSFETPEVAERCDHFFLPAQFEKEQAYIASQIKGATSGQLKTGGGITINGQFRSYDHHRFLVDIDLRVVCFVRWPSSTLNTGKQRYLTAVHLCWFLLMHIATIPLLKALEQQKS